MNAESTSAVESITKKMLAALINTLFPVHKRYYMQKVQATSKYTFLCFSTHGVQ